jgi:hypothetical protein
MRKATRRESDPQTANSSMPWLCEVAAPCGITVLTIVLVGSIADLPSPFPSRYFEGLGAEIRNNWQFGYLDGVSFADPIQVHVHVKTGMIGAALRTIFTHLTAAGVMPLVRQIGHMDPDKRAWVPFYAQQREGKQ